jgi:hypothetical protein
MTETVTEQVRAAAGTELDRLAGDKLLLAATGATLEDAAVLGALRRALRTAADASAAWAGDAPDPVADALAEAGEGFEAAQGVLDDDGGEPGAEGANEGSDAPSSLDLGDPATPLERAGACCVGAPLVLDGLALQGVSHFVNEADAAEADRARAARSEIDAAREDATATLVAACAGEDDTEAVVAGAVGAVEASYEDFATEIEAMGLDPKPVC